MFVVLSAYYIFVYSTSVCFLFTVYLHVCMSVYLSVRSLCRLSVSYLYSACYFLLVSLLSIDCLSTNLLFAYTESVCCLSICYLSAACLFFVCLPVICCVSVCFLSVVCLSALRGNKQKDYLKSDCLLNISLLPICCMQSALSAVWPSSLSLSAVCRPYASYRLLLSKISFCYLSVY